MNMAAHSSLDGMRQHMRLTRYLASAQAMPNESALSGCTHQVDSTRQAGIVPRMLARRHWTLLAIALCSYGVTLTVHLAPAWCDTVPAVANSQAPKLPTTLTNHSQHTIKPPTVLWKLPHATLLKTALAKVVSLGHTSAPHAALVAPTRLPAAKPAKAHGAKRKPEFVLSEMARPHFTAMPLLPVANGPESDGSVAGAPALTKLSLVMPARAWLTSTMLYNVESEHGNRSSVPHVLKREMTKTALRPSVKPTLKVATKRPGPSTHVRLIAGDSKEVAVAQLPPAKVLPTTTTTPILPPTVPTVIAGTTPATTVANGNPGNNNGQVPLWVSPTSKIIAVDALKLPPLTQPLPAALQAASVSADTSYISSVTPSLPPNASGNRLAQNPDAPPVRQPAQPLTSSEHLPNQLEVAVSSFVVLLTTTDLQTVAVADPNIADVAVVNARAVLVNGKMPGITSLVVVDRQKIRQFQVRVVQASGTRPTDVAAAIGIQGVNVRQVKDALVLEGEVANADEMKRAVDMATIFSPKVVNQLTVRPNDATTPAGQAAATAQQIQEAINIPGVTVRVAGDTILLQGTVPTRDQFQNAEKIATAVGKPRTVVNLLQLPTITLEQAMQSIGGTLGTGVPQPVAPTVGNNPSIGSMVPAVSPRQITVRQAADQIILEGTAANQADIDQAVAIATRTGLQVVNRLSIAPALPNEAGLLNSIAMAINQPGVTVSGSVKRLVLRGTVPDTNAAVAAEQIARAFGAQVDNMLQTANPVLVDVDVTIAEVDKTKLRNFGITFPSLLDTGSGFTFGQIPDTTGGNPFNPGLRSGPSGPFALNSVTPFQATLRAVVETGSGRLLSNPHTTVLSGRTATFQVGGQVPIPEAQTIGAAGQTTAIVFKDFGILVDVVPSASTDGVVTMRLRTEVSQPDFTLGFAVPGGGTIPGFSRRATETEVTVRPRGTIALAGLIQNNVNTLIRKVPVLGNIPVLGALFSSRRYQRNETELVIFVTPTVLPNPLQPGTLAPAGVVAVGNTTNAGTVLGNPGINSFNSGTSFGIGSGSSGGGGGGAGGGGQ
ncbi:MAG: BON domain-containing protein [Abitibacteriaceae bacterium]|nr:BON domain-containing protein [Abditibacteriaceae bacterium]MBV9866848.1 BON domain-containing protein [Abditibacteriaceae bacterium]